MIPETRQDRRPASPTAGAVAVRLPDGHPLGEWAVMTLDRGGAYCTTAEVADWTPLYP